METTNNYITKGFLSRKHKISINNATFIKTNASIDKLNKFIEQNKDWLEKCTFHVKNLYLNDNDELVLENGILWVGVFNGSLENVTIVPFEDNENEIFLKGKFLNNIKIKIPEYEKFGYVERHKLQIKHLEKILLNFKNYEKYDKQTIKEVQLTVERIFLKHKTLRDEHVKSFSYHRNGFDNKYYATPISYFYGTYGHSMFHYLFVFQKIRVVDDKKLDLEVLKTPTEKDLRTIIRCLDNNKIYEFNGFWGISDIVLHILKSENKKINYINISEVIVNPELVTNIFNHKSFLNDEQEHTIIDKMVFNVLESLGIDFHVNKTKIDIVLNYEKEKIHTGKEYEYPISFLYKVFDYEVLHLLKNKPYYSKRLIDVFNINKHYIETFFNEEIRKLIKNEETIFEIKKQFDVFINKYYFVFYNKNELENSKFVNKEDLKEIYNIEKDLICYYIATKFDSLKTNDCDTYYRFMLAKTLLNNKIFIN